MRGCLPVGVPGLALQKLQDWDQLSALREGRGSGNSKCWAGVAGK